MSILTKTIMRKSHHPDEIFQVRFWCNEKGWRSINGESNRKKANAIMLFGQTYFPEFFPSKEPILHIDILALMVGSSKLKAIACSTWSC